MSVRQKVSQLKAADVASEALELFKKINRLEEPERRTKAATDEKTRADLRLKISELHAVYDMKMQSYHRGVTTGNASAVKASLKGAMDR